MKKNDTSGGWLKKHRKQVAVHCLVLGAFALYCIFLAGPVSDRLEGIPRESRLHEISLPATTTNIKYYIDRFDVRARLIETAGWAFIKGEDCEDIEHYLVLKSDDNTYIFDMAPVPRRDVTRAFKHLELDLDWSGFEAMIPLRKIASGEYIVGIYIYIQKDNIEALQYTKRGLVKSKDAVELIE